MPADSVEREILIEASPEIVWGVITKAEEIGRWLSDAAELECRVGADGRLSWRPGGRGGNRERTMVVPVRVVEVQPFRRFSFRWNYPEGSEPAASNSALVEFSLIEEAGGTRLRVLESGIDAVTADDEARLRYLEEHGNGWGRHLGELQDHLASPAGRPR